MVKCAVPGCTNYQGKRQTNHSIKFFTFPRDSSICSKWISACGEGAKFNFKIARICSEHFTEQDWRLEHRLLDVSVDKKRLKSDAVPTQNLTQLVDSQSAEQSEAARKQKELVKQAMASYAETGARSTSSNSFQAEDTSESSDNQPNYMEDLRKENQELRLEATKLLQRVRKAESVVSNMRRMFTKSQMKRLHNPKKNCNWSYEDVSNSISLFTSSSLMYKMLWKRKYPFPSPSTLRKWTSTLKLRPGIIFSTIKSLEESKYNERDRLCILSFYEIRLRAHQMYEPSDAGLRPYKYAQVFIMRGLVGDWKYIIYYNFDCMMPGLVLKNIVQTLRDLNFIVVAAVSGVGPRKLALWKELNIDEEHSSFEVVEGEKIFFFANVPHLIKRIRNHFLQTGFLLDGTTAINVDPLSEMLAIESSDLWLNHDLTKAHISPKRVGQHNILVASQLFAQPVAEAIRKCVAMGKMYSQNAIECSDFIQLVDEWFNLFNSKFMTEEGGQGPLAYGLNLREQNAIIASMNDVIKGLKVNASDESLLPFQKGILLNNCSLPPFFEYVKEKYNVTYVITNNLNADDTEHSFGLRRSHGGVAHQPSPLEFKYRLRASILVNLNITK